MGWLGRVGFFLTFHGLRWVGLMDKALRSIFYQGQQQQQEHNNIYLPYGGLQLPERAEANQSWRPQRDT